MVEKREASKKGVVVLHQGVNNTTIQSLHNSWEIQSDVTRALTQTGFNVAPLYIDDRLEWFSTLQKMKRETAVDFVFNCADLGMYLDVAFESHIASMIEVLKIPFTGSSSDVLRSTLDKYLTKLYAREMGIPVPDAHLLSQWNDDENKRREVGYPVILKQRKSYGSAGMTKDSVMHSAEEVQRNINAVLHKGGDLRQFVLEEYLEDPEFKELSCFFVGNTNRKFLKIAHFAFRRGFEGRAKFRDFDVKWDEVARAEFSGLPRELEELTRQYTERIADIFCVRDYGRFDFRVKRNTQGVPIPYVIDINANPDIHSTGDTIKNMLQGAGIPYDVLINAIAGSALQRSMEQPYNASRR